MKQEDKERLLKDMCSRIPYCLKISHGIPTILISVKVDRDGMKVITESVDSEHTYDIEEVKPYLRSMNSITDKEKKEWIKLRGDVGTYINEYESVVDFYNEHHFDYRGLIKDGLALEAPKGMYKYD